MSKTLTFLADLDREFRNRAHMVLKDDQKEQFNQQMDHIVSMFHQHDSDKAVKCYNNKASLKDGQLESTGTRLFLEKSITRKNRARKNLQRYPRKTCTTTYIVIWSYKWSFIVINRRL